MTDNACQTCQRGYTGPLSGYRYCSLLKGTEPLFAHQARQERGPCGPAAAWYLPIKNEKKAA